jgi:hypothetical protein
VVNKVNNSHLELYTPEALQQTDLSEVGQQIPNINKEEREPVPEVVSSSPNQISPKETRQNTSLYAKIAMEIAESGRHRQRGNGTISVRYRLQSITGIRLKDMPV